MKIVFIYPQNENLGIEYISSILKINGHSTYLAFDPRLFNDTIISFPFLSRLFDSTEHIVRDILKLDPDLIAFSVLSDTYSWACELAKRLKEKIKAPIIFGGIHPTSVPERILSNGFVDIVCIGEGEYALLELANSLENRRPEFSISNLWLKYNGKIIKNDIRPLIQDLDLLPFPDKEIFYDHLPFLKRQSYTIITGRGCPYKCSYCSHSFLKRLYKDKGKYLRRRSPYNVIKELQESYKKYKFSSVAFYDDLFTYDSQWLNFFSEIYKKEIGLNCFCFAHPNTISEETIYYLKKMNCVTVELGVQSIDPSVREKYLYRYYSNDDVKKAIALLKNAKIFCCVDNILGLPGERGNNHLNLLKFYNELRPDRIYLYNLRYFPKTEIVDIVNLSEEKKESIEVSKEVCPACLGGDVDTKEIRQIHHSILMIYFLPKKIVKFLIEKRVYKLFNKCSMPFSILNLFIYKIHGWLDGIIKNRSTFHPRSLNLYIGFIIRRFVSYFK